jgi:GntR family transcriptional regulator of arabinose operon
MEKINGYSKLKRGKGKGRPLYQQICRHLVKQINSGELKSGQRLPSISQMVKGWSVDYQTVTVALERMEKEGLIRRERGRGKGPVVLKGTEKKYSMVFVRWNNEGFHLEITEGVRKFAEEKGFDLSVTDASQSKNDLINAISNPIKDADGIILVPPDSPEFRRACIHAQGLGMKIVFADRNLEGLPISSVADDHVGGAHQATRHLLELWNMPVYCLGVTSVSSVQDRLQGWGAAMRRYGFQEHDSLIRCIPDIDMRRKDYLKMEAQYDYNAALGLLKERKKGKICVFTCTGSAAQGLYKAAEELDLKIGQDVFAAGFGDDPRSRRLKVPLTCVPQVFEELGYEAANVLYMEMAGAVKHPMYRLLPAKLQIRQSSTGTAATQTEPYEKQAPTITG